MNEEALNGRALADAEGSVPTGQKFLTDRQCGERYGFSWRHWRRLVDSGRAPQPTRFGYLTRWSLKALQEWEARECPHVRHVPAKGGYL